MACAMSVCKRRNDMDLKNTQIVRTLVKGRTNAVFFRILWRDKILENRKENKMSGRR